MRCRRASNAGCLSGPPLIDVKMRALARRLRIPYVAPLAALCNAHGCITRTGVGGNEITVWDTAHFTRAGSVLLARVGRANAALRRRPRIGRKLRCL